MPYASKEAKAANDRKRAKTPERIAYVKAWNKRHSESINATQRAYRKRKREEKIAAGWVPKPRMTEEEKRAKGREKHKAYLVRNRERLRGKLREKRRDYRQRNRERINAHGRAYYALQDPERRRAKARAWYAKNRERVKADRRVWKLTHPEETRERRKVQKKRQQVNNPERYRARMAAKRRRRYERLTDGMVRKMIQHQTKLPRAAIPMAMIEAKRATVRVQRLLKEATR